MSQRTVYAIASGKGGVGKTTTAINLGAMLADRGHSVVVVDTDLGMANLADFLDFEIDTPTLHEVLAGDANFEDAIYRAPGDIDVLPSATDIEAFVKSDPANLQDVVADLREEYDYVLLDTGAGVSYDTLVPLALADGVILVATPDVASVRDTAKTGELAERVESDVRGAVLTQRSSDILNADDVEETLGTEVLAVIPEDEAVPMGIDAGRPLAAFAPNAPAGHAYRELSGILTGDITPDPELDLDEEEATGSKGEKKAAEPSERTPETTETDDSDETVEVGTFGDAESADEPESADEGGIGTDEIIETAIEDLDADQREVERLLTSDDSGESSARESLVDDSRDETPGEDSRRETPDDDPLREASEDSGGDDAATANTAETVEKSDAGADEDARSVDDLINEHISEERLGGSNSLGSDDGDDPLAEINDSLGDGEDADENGAETSDPFADETDETDLGDESEDWDDAQDDSEEMEAIPFEGRNSDQATSDGDAGRDDTASDHDESSPAIESDHAAEPTDSADPERERLPESEGSSASSPDEDTDEQSDEQTEEDNSEGSGGVLGRIGSLFN